MSEIGQKFALTLIIVLVLGYFLGQASMYTINEREQAVVLQFGQPVAARTQAGLYFKWPFIQEVRRFPNTLQFWQADFGNRVVDLPTSDGRKVEVTPWCVWRISDPLQFVKVLRTVDNAELRMTEFVRSAVRDVITSYPLEEVIRLDDRKLTYQFQIDPMIVDKSTKAPEAVNPVDIAGGEMTGNVKTGREKIIYDILTKVRERIQQAGSSKENAELTGSNRGIEIQAVGITRIDFVPTVRQETFNRLIAFWQSIASRLENEGEQLKQEKLNRTHAEVERIEGEGARQASILRGTADATIIRMFNDAIREAGDFYSFTKTLELYQKTLNAQTQLVLTTENELLQLLKNSQPLQAPDQKSTSATETTADPAASTMDPATAPAATNLTQKAEPQKKVESAPATLPEPVKPTVAQEVPTSVQTTSPSPAPAAPEAPPLPANSEPQEPKDAKEENPQSPTPPEADPAAEAKEVTPNEAKEVPPAAPKAEAKAKAEVETVPEAAPETPAKEVKQTDEPTPAPAASKPIDEPAASAH